MNWTLFRKIVRIGGSLVGFCIFLFLVYDGVNKLVKISPPLEFSWTFVMLAFVLFFLSYLFHMINYKLIYKSSHQEVSLVTTIVGYSFSFLPKYIPGFIWGYYSRSNWFEEKARIPSGYSWQASAIELLVTVLTCSSIWLGYIFTKNTQIIWICLILIIPFLAIIPINKCITFFKVYSRTEKWFGNFDTVGYRYWLIITLISYFQRVLFGIGLWALSKIFSQTDLVNLQEMLNFTYSFARSWLSGFLAILIPNGLGVREIVLTELLVEVNNVSSSVSTIISTLSRLLMLFAEFGWLILAIFVNCKLKKQRYIESIIE